MVSIFAKAAVFLYITLGTLCFALIYKAYVLNHPCEHKLKKLDKANRFKLRGETLDRLRQALAYATVLRCQQAEPVGSLRLHHFIWKGKPYISAEKTLKLNGSYFLQSSTS